jgi:hypothetical protein
MRNPPWVSRFLGESDAGFAPQDRPAKIALLFSASRTVYLFSNIPKLFLWMRGWVAD